jgi:iron complex transport system substrate-binding protein
MKPVSQWIPLLLAAALLLGACSPMTTPPPMPTEPPAHPTSTPLPSATPAVTATPKGIILPDGMGGEFTLAAPVQRVVSLAPSTTEILYAIGAGKQVVAREDFANYPEEALALPSLGGFNGDYDLEALVNLTPDLVLAAPITAPEQIKGMQDLGLTVMVLPNPRDLNGMYANLILVGQATGHHKEAEDLVLSLQAREQKVMSAISYVTVRPVVFYELDGTDPSKPWTTGPDTFIDLLINLAGGRNVGASLTGEWAQFSLEELLVQEPDFILLGDSNFGMTAEQVAARAGWDGLSAVKENKVLPFNDDLASRPGPRLLDGLEEMVRIFHPDLADKLK